MGGRAQRVLVELATIATEARTTHPAFHKACRRLPDRYLGLFLQ